MIESLVKARADESKTKRTRARAKEYHERHKQRARFRKYYNERKKREAAHPEQKEMRLAKRKAAAHKRRAAKSAMRERKQCVRRSHSRDRTAVVLRGASRHCSTCLRVFTKREEWRFHRRKKHRKELMGRWHNARIAKRREQRAHFIRKREAVTFKSASTDFADDTKDAHMKATSCFENDTPIARKVEQKQGTDDESYAEYVSASDDDSYACLAREMQDEEDIINSTN